ncbi:unnamed protein product [Phytophthora fragariaefolia]|uniref:Unnamed protein product n=1 Tax=Phytophthora fragariaefolia TaxID=1490495 RepID=A0A9W6XCM2_9STRA|nr:unnamed protein product [Phytophthora fragariaefolia]
MCQSNQVKLHPPNRKSLPASSEARDDGAAATGGFPKASTPRLENRRRWCVAGSAGGWKVGKDAHDVVCAAAEILELLPEGVDRAGPATWTSFQKASHDVDGLEVSRAGSTAHTVKIKLLAAQTPERFSISPELEAAIGQYLGPAKAHTKQDIVLAMWEYIKLRNLIKEDDCRVVVCDERLVQVLNCVSLPFTSIVVALKQHLTPINSIDLEYTLSLSTACESELLDEKFFDISVAATSDLDRMRVRALKECEELQHDQKKELALLQAQELDILERLQMHTRKKEWMAQFAQDPCGFMADVKKSQLADEEVRLVISMLFSNKMLD